MIKLLATGERSVRMRLHGRVIEGVVQESGDIDIFEADGRPFEYATDEVFEAVVAVIVGALPDSVFDD